MVRGAGHWSEGLTQGGQKGLSNTKIQIQIHKYANTQIQIHTYKNTNTYRQMVREGLVTGQRGCCRVVRRGCQIPKYKYANTQIQIHTYKNTNTYTQMVREIARLPRVVRRG